MPIGKSAKKSLRQALRNKKSNYSFKDKLKEAIKSFLAKPTKEGLELAQSLISKAKKKNLWHANKSARITSELAKKLANPETTTKIVKKAKKTAKKVVKKTTKKM